MSVSVQREYKLKFYLNAQHYVVFNGKKGATHPHTWEFSLNIMVPCNTTTQFSEYERGINSFLAQYQDKVLNDTPTFEENQPTLENIVEIFTAQFDRIITNKGAALHSVEGSEGPTRSYMVIVEDDIAQKNMVELLERDVVDAVLDEALV